MQPFHFVLLLFTICLAHGIYRAILDSKNEAVQAYFDALWNSMATYDNSSQVLLIHLPCSQVKDVGELFNHLKEGKE